jgi:prepilin-type N-terminal cleavage/methylation domain-containing protein
VRSRSTDTADPAEGGFALVELIVALAIFSMLLTATVPMVLSTARASQITAWRATTGPILRDAIDAAIGEVRSASPLPYCASPLGSKTLSTCRRVDPNVRGSALASATTSGLCVYSDRPAPAVTTGALRQPLWKTCVSATGGVLSADHYAPVGTIVASAPTLIDTTYAASATDTSRLSDTKAVFTFDYRDATNTVITPTQLSSQLANVAVIVITATATKTGSGNGETETVSSTLSLRDVEYGAGR